MLAEVDESWLERRYYGGDLPADAERFLHLAAASYGEPATAESWLAQAARAAPGHRLVDLGHYKYHFYRANLDTALGYGWKMVGHALAALGRNDDDWRLVTRGTADFSGLDPAPRLFLFALTACGYLLLRLGRRDEGREVLIRVRDLDTTDRMGASRLLAIDERHGQDEED